MLERFKLGQIVNAVGLKGENKVFVVAFDKDGNKTWGSKVTVVKE